MRENSRERGGETSGEGKGEGEEHFGPFGGAMEAGGGLRGCLGGLQKPALCPHAPGGVCEGPD